MALSPKPGFTFDPLPAPEVLRYLEDRQLKPSFDYRDVWKEEHVAAFTVAKAMSVDVLGTFKEAIRKAEQEGVPFRQFQKELQPQLEKLGWWGRKDMIDPITGETREVQLGSPRRLKVIYRTNLAVAHAAGRWERLQRTAATRPFLRYRLGPSEVHRPQHAAWEGTTLPLDHEFWAAHYPPNGWGCKCWVQALTRPDVEKSGGPSEPPPVKTKRWLNKRTGQVERVPEGIDPGFDYNPGRARIEHLREGLTEKLAAADPEVAHAALRSFVPTAIRPFLDKPKGDLPVLRLPDPVRETIGARPRMTVLSPETARKQRAAHPDLKDSEYALLPEMGVAPDLIVQDAGQTVVIVKRDGAIYWAAVKATRTGKATYLTSFHRAEERHVRRLLRTGKLIQGEWKE